MAKDEITYRSKKEEILKAYQKLLSKDKTNISKVSDTSSKDKIWKAYKEMLTKYEQDIEEQPEEKVEAEPQVKKEEKIPYRLADKRVEVQEAAKESIVNRASANTMESIVKGLADFKLKIGKGLTDLSEQLTEEANKLTEVKLAIDIETRRLEEIHDIRVSAETLADLIRAQEERKETFETGIAAQEEHFKNEMTRRKDEWAKEQKEHELSVKERDAQLKKEREREREEYDYNLALARKKDHDIYDAKKAALENELKEKKLRQEKELSEREANISGKEKEFSELKSQVDKFPAELSETVKKAEKEAAAQAENKAKVEAQLRAKGVEGEKKLSEQKISSLESTLVGQNAQIEVLTKQLHAANAQVQDIAVKVIEGNSEAKAFNKVNQIALEQAKNLNAKK